MPGLVFLVGSGSAVPGALDSSFGVNGSVTTVIGNEAEAYALLRQPDGKLVVAGRSRTDPDFLRMTLVRYNPDGSRDSGFGTSGVALGTRVEAWDAVLQPDGKIVAIGDTSDGAREYFDVDRFNADGSLDSGFGTAGEATTPVGASGEAFAGAMQSDGKIVVAGRAQPTPSSPVHFALARYNSDGSLDSSFGSGGSLLAGTGESDDVAVQPDGKIVVVGDSNNGSQPVFTVLRFNPDGSPDLAFGSGGVVTTLLSSGDVPYSIAVQPDGKLVVGGLGYSSRGVAELVRYNADGSLDSSFGSGGAVTTVVGSYENGIDSLALEPDGKIVAVGSSGQGGQGVFTLYRYNANGSPDAGFGINGVALGRAGSASDLVLQPDGRTVVAGSGPVGGFSLNRFLGNTLTIVRAGRGSGSVNSAPAGISCGGTCSVSVADGHLVTLSAVAAAGSVFAGWSGAGCSGSGNCQLQMDGDRSVTATFNRLTSRLEVNKLGDGLGTVASNPAGIKCGSSCGYDFDRGSSVVLTATPAAGSKFSGWSGGCSGLSPCVVTMDAAHSATATFQRLCIVPNIKRATLAGARALIKRRFCAVGKVSQAFSPKVKRGHVISQKPAPGRRLPRNSKVRLTVSKGKHRPAR